MSFAQFNNVPFGISVQDNAVAKWSGVQKFGYNPTVGSTFETVWDGGNVYTYISTASTATATSDAAASADDGTTVKVFGLDANYDQVEETLTVGAGAGTVEFQRIYRAYVVNAAAGITNVGNVNITVDSVVAARINATNGQTLMCVYTIPRNYQAFVMQIDAGAKKNQEHELRMVARSVSNGNAFNTKAYVTMTGGFFEKNYHVPIKLPPKTDIELQATASATSAVAGGFELFLEQLKG